MKIEHMKIVDKGSTLKAFFTLDLVKLKISNMRLMQQQGQAMWISGPQEQFTAKDGTKKYKGHIFFADKDLQAKATELAVAEYEKNAPSTMTAAPVTVDETEDDDLIPF